MTATKNVTELTDDELIKVHEGLVYLIVNRYFRRRIQSIQEQTSFDLDDLYQVGRIGLLKAKGDFDATKGTKFSTYATQKILGEVKRAIRDNKKVKVSRQVVEVSNAIAKDELYDLTVDQIAEKFNVSKKIARESMEYRHSYVSLNQELDFDRHDNMELQEMLLKVDDFSADIDNSEVLDRFYATISDRERLVWEMYIDGGLRQDDIAEKLGISQMTVSRIVKKVELKAAGFGKSLGFC